jgi:hypothetical protein
LGLEVKTKHVDEFTEAVEVVDVADEDEQIQKEVCNYVWSPTMQLINPVLSWNDSIRRPPVEQSASDGKPMKSRGRRSRECSYK